MAFFLSSFWLLPKNHDFVQLEGYIPPPTHTPRTPIEGPVLDMGVDPGGTGNASPSNFVKAYMAEYGLSNNECGTNVKTSIKSRFRTISARNAYKFASSALVDSSKKMAQNGPHSSKIS